MNHIKKIFFIINIYLILLFNNINVEGKVVTLRNSDNSFDNIGSIIANNQNNKELIINLEDEYYDMSKLSQSFEFPIMTNIKLIGNNNGTVFDYKNKYRGIFNLKFAQNKNETIIFENIIFNNLLDESGPSYEINIFFIEASSDNFNLIFNNCLFQYNHGCILRTESKCVKSSRTDDSAPIIFNNCNFL